MQAARPEDARREASSFRDPSGFVFRRNGVVYRQVNRCYAPVYQQFLSSGLYRRLVDGGLLLPHEPCNEPAAGEDAHVILRPKQLGFVSYPYEWCFSQLKDAALLTLKIQAIALEHGMTLKDASAYNVQFDAGRPVFIDALSFDPYSHGQPWIAYGQFCRHFLAPLALMARVDVRLGQLLRVHVDGVPLDLASRLLPLRTRLSLGLGLHVHAHASSQRKHADAASSRAARPAHLDRRDMVRLIEHLQSTVQSLHWRAGKTTWADYYQCNNNYGDSGLAAKETVLRRLLMDQRPRLIWDLGGNTGRFTRVAAESGGLAICWDIDPACVEANYRHARQANETNILPLLLDLTNPSPALGWAGCERASLFDRGPADLLLALGLVHHLAIGNNVPLNMLADMLARLGRTLLIEFVPKQDSQVQKLLATREDIFCDYHRDGFEQAFSRRFTIECAEEIAGTVRTIYRMRAKACS